MVAVSGGFDPVHVGHIRMFRAARRFGRVIVLLNSDRFLTHKKSKPFMPFAERMEILESLRYVHRVYPVIDEDMTVCETLRYYRPHYFANGGDRHAENTPEYHVCEDLGITMLFGIGGDKVQSSSTLIENSRQ